MEKIDCDKCEKQHACCKTGAWVDLEEAKKIMALGIKAGEFHQLEQDKDFPSGYCVATSYNSSPCTFLTPDGLCAIHKIDYNLKPHYCKEFPYEDGKLAYFVKDLCHEYKKINAKKNLSLKE